MLSVLPWNITLPILANMNYETHSQVVYVLKVKWLKCTHIFHLLIQFNNISDQDPEGCIPQKLRWAHSSHLSKNEVGVMGQQEFRQFMWYLIHGEEEE